MGNLLPEDILKAMKEKHGMNAREVEKAYYFFWRFANSIALNNRPNKVENIGDGDIHIPHIGKLLLKPKIVNYVRNNAKIQKH